MPNNAQNVLFVSLGCPKNRVDSEVMIDQLDSDYELTTDAQEYDSVGVIVSEAQFEGNLDS